MSRRILILTLFFWPVAAISLQAQSVIYRDTTPHLTVPFLYERPKVDGRADLEIAGMAAQRFGTLERSDSTKPFPEATYRLAYGADFFYVYLEVPASKVTYRDRGYQNGDGIVMVISSVETGNQPTREFYVLGFTPKQDTNQAWQKAFAWYHDVDLAMKPLGRTQFAFSEMGDKVGYEILIPWTDLYPYHPWLGTTIGFNLCYAGAVGEKDRAYELVVSDDDIQSEQHARRYTPLTFVYPSGGTTRAAVRLERNNIHQGQTINAIAAYIADSNVTQELKFRTYNKVRGNCCDRITPMVGTGKVDTSSVYMPTLGLSVGDYRIVWSCGVDSGTFDFTVLPNYDRAQTKREVGGLGAPISRGSKSTLQFMLNQIENELGDLKPYASADQLRKEMTQLLSLLAAAKEGNDKLNSQTGVLRRAFRSKIDSTLQPYSLNVPAKFDRKRRYPLVVFLHGSGRDDRGVLPLAMISDTMFILAPFGRGTSTFYSADHAQEDILEAIKDVEANYPIDPAQVVISGFSMGGYGAYRAFYEKPKRYRAVAIFSGHPNLANERGGKEREPNFLKAKYEKPFKGKDIFIFHGGRDRNCPVEITQEVVSSLKSAGANLTFVLEPEAGHQYPNDDSILKFREWLASVLKP